MPLIRIEYDNAVVSNNEASLLSVAMRDIVSETTEIDDVFVYANSAEIKIQAAPIEVFVEMSAHKINNLDELAGNIRKQLFLWKEKTQFSHLINFTIIPMTWKIEIGI